MSGKMLALSVSDRSRGLGGSDIGSLFGMNKWMPLPKLWLQKTGRLPKGGGEENEFQEWGKLLEAPIAKKFAEKTGRRIRKPTGTLVHAQYPCMIGNPDRFQWDANRPKGKQKGVLEVKATMFGNMRAWSTSGVPATYYLQLQHYLAISGLSWGSFAVLFGGNKLVEFDVERDDAIIAVIIARALEFWSLVESKTAPTITLSSEWNKELASFFPTATKGQQLVEASPEAIGRARRVLALRQQIKRRELQLDEHEVWLKQRIGQDGGERLLIPGVARISWTLGERKHLDLDKLRQEHPEIAKALTVSQPQRRFSIASLEAQLEEVDGDEAEPEPILFGARRIELD